MNLHRMIVWCTRKTEENDKIQDSIDIASIHELIRIYKPLSSLSPALNTDTLVLHIPNAGIVAKAAKAKFLEQYSLQPRPQAGGLVGTSVLTKPVVSSSNPACHPAFQSPVSPFWVLRSLEKEFSSGRISFPSAAVPQWRTRGRRHGAEDLCAIDHT